MRKRILIVEVVPFIREEIDGIVEVTVVRLLAKSLEIGAASCTLFGVIWEGRHNPKDLNKEVDGDVAEKADINGIWIWGTVTKAIVVGAIVDD